MAASNRLAVVVRGLSTSSNAAQMIKPPLQVFGLEGRYATALYSAATKQKQLEQVEKELISIQQTIKSSVKVREMVESPIINRKFMSNALKESASQLRMSASTSNLLELLSTNGRLKKFDGIVNAFKAIMAAHRGDIVCEVVTASPLDDAQKKKLEAALKAFIKQNESIQLTTRVDPNIIGGLIVSIADKYVDMSIASKIKMYNDLISATA